MYDEEGNKRGPFGLNLCDKLRGYKQLDGKEAAFWYNKDFWVYQFSVDGKVVSTVRDANKTIIFRVLFGELPAAFFLLWCPLVFYFPSKEGSGRYSELDAAWERLVRWWKESGKENGT